MNRLHSRREFLADVGRGALIATVGAGVAADLGLTTANAEEAPASLAFGSLEPLVRLMQETPADKLLPKLVFELSRGTTVRNLVAAAAFANARTFGGEDYVGFHTMMALAPALHMAGELPATLQPLPVFKVLYRNTKRIQERGGRKDEVLRQVEPAKLDASRPCGDSLLAAVRGKDVNEAERTFAAVAERSPNEALDQLLFAVE